MQQSLCTVDLAEGVGEWFVILLSGSVLQCTFRVCSDPAEGRIKTIFLL
jgi:hypothetical protein